MANPQVLPVPNRPFLVCFRSKRQQHQNPFTMTMHETSSQLDEHVEDDDTNYPPFKIVLPAMAAVWLAFFVVALVSITYPLVLYQSNDSNRIGRLLEQRFQLFRKSSTASVTLDGTRLAFSSHSAYSSSRSDASTNTIR